MTTIRKHMSLSVKGALQLKKKLNFFTHDDGRPMTDKEARGLLMIADFEGKKVIPMGDCDNFDFQEGCRGHEIKDESEPKGLRDII